MNSVSEISILEIDVRLLGVEEGVDLFEQELNMSVSFV